MFKQIINTTCVLIGLLLTQSSYAAPITIHIYTVHYDSPQLSAVDLNSGVRTMTSSITEGSFFYDDADGTGTSNMSSSDDIIFGDMEIVNASLTTNTDGSFHVDGILNF